MSRTSTDMCVDRANSRRGEEAKHGEVEEDAEDTGENIEDDFSIDDIKRISPGLSAIVDKLNQDPQLRPAAAEHFSLELDQLAAYAAAKIYHRGNNYALTGPERAAIASYLPPRRPVEKRYGAKVIEDEKWDGRGKVFFKLAGYLARRLSLSDFAAYTNAARYEDNVQLWCRFGDSFQKRHLRRVRAMLDHNNPLLPIRTISDLRPQDQKLYEFDHHGFLHLTSSKQKIQRNVFGTMHSRPLHIAPSDQLPLPAINFLVRGIAEGGSNVLALPSVMEIKRVRDLALGKIETDHWEFKAAPYRFKSWWYVAVGSCNGCPNWVLFSLSKSAPNPKWPAEAERRTLTDIEHDQATTSFLVVACMRDILSNPAHFEETVKERGWNVDAIRKEFVADLLSQKNGQKRKDNEGGGKDRNKKGMTRKTSSGTNSPSTKPNQGSEKAAPNDGQEVATITTERPSTSHDDHASGQPTSSVQTAGSAPMTKENNLRLISYVPDSRSIDTLRDSKFLNDTMIYFGLRKLGEEHRNRSAFFFNPFLVEELQQGKPCTAWPKNDNISEYRRIILPLHDRQKKHWRIAVLWQGLDNPSPSKSCDFKIVVLDPEPGSAVAYERLFFLLEKYFSRLHICLEVAQPPNGLPKQEDRHNCGVYCLAYVAHILQDMDKFEHAVEQGTSLGWEVDAPHERALLRQAATEELRTEKRSDIVDILNSDDEFFLSVANLLDTHRPTSPFSPGEYEFQPNEGGDLWRHTLSKPSPPGSEDVSMVFGMANDNDMQITADPGSPTSSPVGRKRGASAPLTPRPYKRHAASQDTASPTPPGLADSTQTLSEDGHCGPRQARQAGPELTTETAISTLSKYIRFCRDTLSVEEWAVAKSVLNSQLDRLEDISPGLEGQYSPALSPTSGQQSPPLSDESPVIVPGHLGQQALFDPDFPIMEPQPEADPPTLSLETESQPTLLAGKDLENRQPVCQDVIATACTNPAHGPGLPSLGLFKKIQETAGDGTSLEMSMPEDSPQLPTPGSISPPQNDGCTTTSTVANMSMFTDLQLESQHNAHPPQQFTANSHRLFFSTVLNTVARSVAVPQIHTCCSQIGYHDSHASKTSGHQTPEGEGLPCTSDSRHLHDPGDSKHLLRNGQDRTTEMCLCPRLSSNVSCPGIIADLRLMNCVGYESFAQREKSRILPHLRGELRAVLAKSEICCLHLCWVLDRVHFFIRVHDTEGTLQKTFEQQPDSNFNDEFRGHFESLHGKAEDGIFTICVHFSSYSLSALEFVSTQLLPQ